MESNLATVLQLDAHSYEQVIPIMIFTKRNSCTCVGEDIGKKFQVNVICNREKSLTVHQ